MIGYENHVGQSAHEGMTKLEPKTEVGANVKPGHLTICVKDSGGDGTHFKIKYTTLMSKVIDAYCKKENLNPRQLRFLFGQTTVTPTSTPLTLDMEDGDEIDIVSDQSGGVAHVEL